MFIKNLYYYPLSRFVEIILKITLKLLSFGFKYKKQKD